MFGTARFATEKAVIRPALPLAILPGLNGTDMAAKRKEISKKVRFEVFKRDRFMCAYCGRHPPDVKLHADHIIAVANGGTNDLDNLVTSCEPCNLGKSATPLTDVPQSLASKAADVAEREEQLAGYAEVMEAKRDRIENDTWRVAEILEPGCSEKGYGKADLKSISMFVEKLGVYEVIDAAEIASTKFYPSPKQFRYFCGICWSKIKEAGGN